MTDITKRPRLDLEYRDTVFGPEGGLAPGSKALQPITAEGIAELRADSLDQLDDDETLSQNGSVTFRDILIPGLDGDPEIPALVLTPTNSTGNRPALVFTHCGGKIVSHPRTKIFGLGVLDWVARHQIAIVVAGVRVGPEDPHPAQVRDGFAALRWTSENAGTLGVDPSRIGLLGVSGGGGVAAGTALYARDHGGPPLAHLILLTPMLDDRESFQSNRFEEVVWPRRSNATGWTAILGDSRGGPDVSEYAAASRAIDLTGLPPTFIETYSADIFRDEAIDFASRLMQTGAPVDLHVWAGVMHRVEDFPPTTTVGTAIYDARRSFLARISARVDSGFES
ncbi:alpha/beta hydrolase [Microbacterium jejuense]|uniref:alpha/beta hydrolase n=1 Tax=Microbacterium jejuense TaxID=1263637 RepID=UPI0031E97444